MKINEIKIDLGGQAGRGVCKLIEGLELKIDKGKRRIHHRGHRAHREDWGWESDGDGGLGTWKALGMRRSIVDS